MYFHSFKQLLHDETLAFIMDLCKFTRMWKYCNYIPLWLKFITASYRLLATA